VTTFALTALAALDLEVLLDQVQDASGTKRAEQLRTDLLAAMEMLARMPHSGRARPDLTPREVRFWPVHGFLIAYRAESRPLEIVRVLPGQRDPSTLRVDLGG
jgi:antitoxin ParD1/3/4/toxin ParE1/3/4